ncbi:MAG: phenylacetate--CoA ligase family protein, partial [Dehalococcoidia bacterium]
MNQRIQARLQRLLAHAQQSVAYYQQIWKAAGLHPSSVVTSHQLTSLPPLEKAVLRRHYVSLLSQPLPPASLTYTSATEGRTSVVVTSRQAQRLSAAGLRRLLAEADLPQNAVLANVSPWSRSPVRHRFRGDRGITWIEVGLPEFLQSTTAKATNHADAVVAAPLVLRELVTALGQSLAMNSVTLINCYERLDPTTLSLAKQAGLRLFDLYSASEITTPIAFQCRMCNGLHVNDDYVIVEVVDDSDMPVGPGETGQVLVTDLLNLAMPLIRFRIGDIATTSDGACPCGRSLSRLARIDGRADNYIYLANKEKILVTPAIDQLAAVLPADFCL